VEGHVGHDVERDLDIAASGVGLRAQMVRCLGQGFGNLPIDARQVDVQTGCDPVDIVSQAQIGFDVWPESS
jgi:hypothetical protein